MGKRVFGTIFGDASNYATGTSSDGFILSKTRIFEISRLDSLAPLISSGFQRERAYLSAIPH